jgi:hypothetical protein
MKEGRKGQKETRDKKRQDRTGRKKSVKEILNLTIFLS